MLCRVCLNIDDVEFHEWTLENKFARVWYCQDLRQSELLKLAIENAINRSPHDSVQRCLFQNEKDKQRNQFIGFVSSHTTGKLVDSFHLHSFNHTTWLIFWDSGSLVESQNDVNKSWLKLRVISNCFPHPH